MDFFDESDESHTDSDISDSYISDHEDKTCFDSESAREEDILLRDGLLQHMLPRKNEWTCKSFSKRSCDYVGNMKSKINTNFQSLRTAYNSFDAILLKKAKPKSRHILSSVRKAIYLRDKKQELSPFLCFAAVYPDQYFYSFANGLLRVLGINSLKTINVILLCLK